MSRLYLHMQAYTLNSNFYICSTLTHTEMLQPTKQKRVCLLLLLLFLGGVTMVLVSKWNAEFKSMINNKQTTYLLFQISIKRAIYKDWLSAVFLVSPLLQKRLLGQIHNRLLRRFHFNWAGKHHSKSDLFTGQNQSLATKKSWWGWGDRKGYRNRCQ